MWYGMNRHKRYREIPFKETTTKNLNLKFCSPSPFQSCPWRMGNPQPYFISGRIKPKIAEPTKSVARNSKKFRFRAKYRNAFRSSETVKLQKKLIPPACRSSRSNRLVFIRVACRWYQQWFLTFFENLCPFESKYSLSFVFMTTTAHPFSLHFWM